MNLLAPGSLLAQIRPSSTASTTAFTATLRTEITRIEICDTGTGAIKYSIFHDDDGTTYNQSTAVRFEESVSAGNHATLEAGALGCGLIVKAGGSIGVQSDTANDLTISIYGVTEQAR